MGKWFDRSPSPAEGSINWNNSIHESPSKSAFKESASSGDSVQELGAAELNQFGYKQEFKREFGFFSAFSFAVSISGLMATIGTTFTYPLSAGGAACIVWSWFMGGIGCLCIALSVAEMVSAYPTSGGLYYSCSKVFPQRWAPVVCWVDGWINLLGQVAGVASSDYGAAQMLLSAVSMGSDFTYQPTAEHTVGVMAAVLVFHGFLSSFPTKYIERMTSSYLVFHFGVLIAGAVALLVKSERNDASYVFGHVESSNGWSPIGFSFFFGCLSVSWTMTDYSATAGLAEEMKDPARVAPTAISLAMVFTYVVGFLYNIVLAFCMGDPEVILEQEQPVAYMYYTALGKGGGIFFTVAMFIIMNFVGATALQATSRTMWSQARDGMIPFVGRRWLYRVNKYTLTPLYSVWVSTALCIAINLIALGSSTTITAIFNVCAIALDWSYVIPIFARRWFTDRFTPGPWNMGRFSFIVNWWAILWTFFISVIFFMPETLPVTPQSMNYAVVFFVGIIALAVFFWNIGGYKLYRGPEATAPDPEVAAQIDLLGQVKDEKRE